MGYNFPSVRTLSGPIGAPLASARVFECGGLHLERAGSLRAQRRRRQLHSFGAGERQPILQQQIRVNGRIRAREVRVIVGASGEQLGVMKLSDAIKRAQTMGLDLVEVAPTANPPVCKIVDFGKFRYDISKQIKDKKSSGTKLKEIKFRVNIDDHDYLTKIRHGENFLDKGNKVRVQLQFRGREMAHQEFGMQLMYKVRDDLATMAQVEMEPKAAGRNITMTLSPLPSNKRKRRFSV
ncbi:MAG TPA: translation initiation factor IF-3, partial [Chthoniobacterales bacterium]